MTSVHAKLHPDGSITIPMTRAAMLKRITPCLRAVSPREIWPVLTKDTCLVSDLWLHGSGIVRLGELLEEEFSITLTPSRLIEFALDGPLIGNLLDMVESAHA